MKLACYNLHLELQVWKAVVVEAHHTFEPNAFFGGVTQGSDYRKRIVKSVFQSESDRLGGLTPCRSPLETGCFNL